MPENTIHAELSAAEWSLVQAIREVPETELRERLHEVLGDLLFYVRNPRCQGMGAEGFPCGDPVASCDDCHDAWDFLERISRRVAAQG